MALRQLGTSTTQISTAIAAQATRLTVNGSGVSTYDVDTTPPAVADITGLTTALTLARPKVAKARRASGSGNVTLDQTAMTAFDGAGGLDLTVPAVTGDILQVAFSGLFAASGVVARIDVATLVSSAAVNWLSSSNGTPSPFGVPGWTGISGALCPLSGAFLYTVQAGDLVGANVTVRPYGRVDSASTSRVLFGTTAAAGNPLDFFVVNLGAGA